MRHNFSATATANARVADRATVSLAENIYNYMRDEVRLAKIHRDQISREYGRHEDWIAATETKMNSVLQLILCKYDINLEEYAPPQPPVR